LSQVIFLLPTKLQKKSETANTFLFQNGRFASKTVTEFLREKIGGGEFNK